MSSGLIPRQLALVRGAIASLAQIGLSIDSFSTSLEKWTELENLGCAAKHVAAFKTEDLPKLATWPRTIAGIPVNVKQ